MADDFMGDEDELEPGILGDDEDEDDDLDLGLDDEDDEIDELSPEGLGVHGLSVEEEEDPEM